MFFTLLNLPIVKIHITEIFHPAIFHLKMLFEASIHINVHKENFKTPKQQNAPAHISQSCVCKCF